MQDDGHIPNTVEKQIFDTMVKIRQRDSSIYDANKQFFADSADADKPSAAAHQSDAHVVVLQPGKVERHSQSFWREAEMLSNLNHPNVLRFYGVVVESYAEPNVIGIMTEYMKGGSLAAFLR